MGFTGAAAALWSRRGRGVQSERGWPRRAWRPPPTKVEHVPCREGPENGPPGRLPDGGPAAMLDAAGDRRYWRLRRRYGVRGRQQKVAANGDQQSATGPVPAAGAANANAALITWASAYGQHRSYSDQHVLPLSQRNQRTQAEGPGCSLRRRRHPRKFSEKKEILIFRKHFARRCELTGCRSNEPVRADGVAGSRPIMRIPPSHMMKCLIWDASLSQP